MRAKLNLAAVLTLASLIAFFSVIKPPSGPGGGSGLPLTHLLVYLALAWVLSLHFYEDLKGHFKAVLTAVVFGLAMEILQLFLPGRFFSLADISANTAGASLIMLDVKLGFSRKAVEVEERLIKKVSGTFAEHF